MTTTKTFSPRARHIERRWYVVDADGAVLGRLASEVAKILRGKHKPIFAPHVDTGDHVIVVNARGVRLTGGKENEKVYYRHSGYPGGLREVGYARLLAERPVVAVEKAVRGMLPKNRLGRDILSKLKVYEGPEHPHEAQRPESLGLGELPKWEGLPVPKPQPARPVPEQKAEPARAGRARTAPPAKRATGRARAARTARPAPGTASRRSPGAGQEAKARRTGATRKSSGTAEAAKGRTRKGEVPAPTEEKPGGRRRRAKKES